MFRNNVRSEGSAGSQGGRSARSLPNSRLLVALFLVFSLVLAACNTGGAVPSDEEEPTDTTGTVEEPAETTGATDEPADTTAPPDDSGDPSQLVIDTQWDQLTADPARDASNSGRYILNSVYDTLTKFKPKQVDGEWEVDLTAPDPWIAESWEVDDSGQVWTFNIRQGVVFSDGTPMTAEDVAWSLRRVKNVNAAPASNMEPFEEITAVDDATVQITTTDPNPAVPFILTHNAMGVVNRAVAEENGATDAEDAEVSDTAEAFFNENSLGTGPYVFRQFSTTADTVLVRNPNFWGDQPFYDQLVFRNVTPEVARLNVQSGQSDLAMGLTSEQASTLPDTVTVHSAPSATVFYVQANFKEEVSDLAASQDLWEAVRYGLDYEKLLRLAGEGAIQACGLVPVQFNGALDESECVTRDIERAQEALSRTGVDNPTLVLEFPTDFTLEGVSFQTISEAVQADLQEIGLEVELEGAPLSTWLPRWMDALPEMTQGAQNPTFPHENSTSVYLPTGYRGQYAGFTPDDAPEITELGEQAQETLDDDERAELYRELQQVLNTESPIIPQFQSVAIIAAQSTVQGVVVMPIFFLDPTILHE